MTIKEKILAYLDIKGIKRGEFFEAIGVAPSNFKGAAKNSELGGDKIAKILTTYPDLSAEWLMADRGEMLKTNRTFDSPSSVTSTSYPFPKHKDSTNQAIPQDVPPLMDRLLSIISEKDAVIRSQAEEIGRLREQIDQLKQVRGHDVPDAISSDAAIAG